MDFIFLLLFVLIGHGVEIRLNPDHIYALNINQPDDHMGGSIKKMFIHSK